MKKHIIYCLFIVFFTKSYDYLPDNLPLNQALLALSHNGAQSKAYGWRYYQQLGDVRAQWKAGSRGDKVNIQWRRPVSIKQQLQEEAEKKGNIFEKITSWFTTKKDSKPYLGLCHEPNGKSNCLVSRVGLKDGEIDKAEDYLRQWAQLLKENPKDIIVMVLEDYTHENSKENGTLNYSKQQIRQELDHMLERSGLAQYAYKLDKNNTMPTIGQMRKSGKRALLFDDSKVMGPDGRPVYYIVAPVFSNAQHSPYLNKADFLTTHWIFDWQKNLQTGVCRMRGQKKQTVPYFIIDVGPEQSFLKGTKKGHIFKKLEQLGITDIKGHDVRPTDYAVVNSKANLKKRVNQCQNQAGIPVNAMKIDFIEIGPVYETVKEINRQRIKKWQLQS